MKHNSLMFLLCKVNGSYWGSKNIRYIPILGQSIPHWALSAKRAIDTYKEK